MTPLPQELGFEVHERIARAPEDLYRAVTQPTCSCRYFMVGATRALETGAVSVWSWPSGPDVTVKVLNANPPTEVVFTWKAHAVDYDTRVTITFTPSPGAPGETTVRVHEHGWKPDAAGIASSYEHCAGWQHMLCGLKAWAMHGVDHRSMEPALAAMPDAPELPRHAAPAPRIQTQRLLLRQHEPADLPVMAERLNDMDVVRYTLRMPHPYTLEAAQAFFRNTRVSRAAGKSLVWAMTLSDSGEFIGGIGLRIEPEHQSAELGYALARPFWGRGYATEAAEAVTRYAFESLNLHRVEASYFSPNTASGRVLEKAGFVREGVHRGKGIRFGQRMDLIMTAAIREEWMKRS